MTTERWKKVIGHPDYEVSEQGRVRRALDATPHHATYPGRTLTPVRERKAFGSPDKWRLKVNVGGNRHRYIHHLVLEAFVGPRKGRETNHKDGDPQNNAADNLEWVTPEENQQHARENGLGTPKGEDAPWSKLTEAQVREMVRRAKAGEKQQDLAEEYGVGKSAVSQIVHGKAWSHLEDIEWKEKRRKLSDEQARKIKALAGKVKQRDLAERYGVSPRLIFDIIHGRSYADVT